MQTFQRNLMMATAAIVAVATASPAQAQKRTFNVPAGPATRTVPAFAKQAGAQILGTTDVLEGRRTQAVKGDFTIREGLQRLFAGTELAPRYGDGGIITLGLVERGNASGASGGEDEAQGISEILVIGRRSRNVDVRRTENDAQPYVVFDRQEIESSQATTVEEFLRTRLTQNAGAGGSRSQSTGNGAPFSTFNLRGLGANQTLILVNGRRLPVLANQNFEPGQADINGIPVGSIERIEVLPTSAGGIYGGNAVGGVINIILRSDYRGAELTATYNDTFDFHAPNGRLDVNGGFALESGRTTVTFGGSLSRSGTLRVKDRVGVIKDGIDLYRENISPYVGNGLPPIGNGVNIRSANGSNLVLDPQYGGANLGSNVTNLPVGYAGVGSDKGALLVANAGRFNLDTPTDLSGLERGLLTSPRLASFNVSVRRKFFDGVDAFVDYSRLSNKGLSFSANQAPTTVTTLAANAPTNPFQQAIRVSFTNPNLSFPYRQSSRSDTLAAGLIFRLPWQWGFSVEYNKVWTLVDSSFYQAAIDAAGRTCLNTGTTCAGGLVLNPLQTPIDYGPYLFTEPTYLGGPYKSEFDNPSLRASGPLFRLPGGSANLTMALQREATSIKLSRNSIVDLDTRGRSYVIFPGRTQRTNSAYAEVVLPLVAPRNQLPFVRELELRAAVRHDAYRTTSPSAGQSFIEFNSGGTLITNLGGQSSFITSNPDLQLPNIQRLSSRFESTNYTITARYSPVSGIIVRGSYATGFLPPSVAQLGSVSAPAPFGLGNVRDPLRGNELVNYSLTTTGGQGNLALRPEKSRSLSLGAILTPLDGLRVSVDYTRIKKRDEISGLSNATLLANESLFPGRVVRGPASDGFTVGRIVSVDATPINLAKSLYQSVDFQADYTLVSERVGKLRLYGLATWQPDTVRTLLSAIRPLNFTGNADGPLEWQGNAGFDWVKGKLGVRWNTQFYDSYNVFSTQDTSTSNGQTVVNDAITAQGGKKIPSQTYSDIYASYDFGPQSGLLGNVKVSAGIQNVFNQKPPALAISSYTFTGYSTYGDPRLRRFTVSLRKGIGNTRAK